jgi:shikimate kinase
MAAGKTTVGRALAHRMGRQFVDLDELVLERTGRTAGAIIRADGEAAFRRLEAEITGHLAGRSGLVLAPGGGWGANPELARMLGPDTVRVWLRLSAAEAVRRAIASGEDRPLLDPAESPGDDPGADRGEDRGEEADLVRRAERLLQQRESAYAEAELVVDVGGKEPAEVADEIVRRLNDLGGR